MNKIEPRNMRCSIRLLPEERKGLEKLSKEVHRTFTGIIRIAVHEYLIANGIHLETDEQLYKVGWIRKKKA